MVSTKTVIRNPMGMHMRPAGMFANAMMKFDSDVNLVAERMTIVYDETQVTPEQIIAKVEKAGFGAKLHQEKQKAAPVQTGEDPEAVRLIENGLGE